MPKPSNSTSYNICRCAIVYHMCKELTPILFKLVRSLKNAFAKQFDSRSHHMSLVIMIGRKLPYTPHVHCVVLIDLSHSQHYQEGSKKKLSSSWCFCAFLGKYQKLCFWLNSVESKIRSWGTCSREYLVSVPEPELRKKAFEMLFWHDFRLVWPKLIVSTGSPLWLFTHWTSVSFRTKTHDAQRETEFQKISVLFQTSGIIGIQVGRYMTFPRLGCLLPISFAINSVQHGIFRRVHALHRKPQLKKISLLRRLLTTKGRGWVVIRKICYA
jgi:hypothetical protein